MDPALVEARYQRALFKGSLDTLLRDFKLRYGERWEEFYKKSEDAYEKDIVEVERVGEIVRGEHVRYVIFVPAFSILN
ncbi:MAG: hypothetical protein QXH44_09490, partial [Pyrobaculum sp.]